jgi:cyclic beta-1,2-glucan synthetase
MESLFHRLVRQDDQLVLLLTPPFDKTPRDPGYIKGYPPGVRENGGQYTHAGIWAAWAFARLEQGDRAHTLFQMLTPIYHADTPEGAARYKVEPYAVAADIYDAPSHRGRGGWTWYTGASAWMYRLGLEAILGISRAGDALKIDPCIPRNWPRYQITYRFGAARYVITVENPDGVSQGVRRLVLDGKTLIGNEIPLRGDPEVHNVDVVMGPPVALSGEVAADQ